ncbi:hypothetical protein [uncultured Jannaschia sp.]|uniref:hypothetical protein n=1 Tax=uncultured Jannaschia sp. TaxID=293347 RepID=UPI0026145A78|nr:hypothetical protein [uncultured Jannaschia sp.]
MPGPIAAPSLCAMWRLIPFALLAACAELPPVEDTISTDARLRANPVLMPLDPLLAEGRNPSRAGSEQGILLARGAALGRATIAVPRTDDLDVRARRLRDRAEALRAAEI